jgi:hypothetical protein
VTTLPSLDAFIKNNLLNSTAKIVVLSKSKGNVVLRHPSAPLVVDPDPDLVLALETIRNVSNVVKLLRGLKYWSSQRRLDGIFILVADPST